MPVARQHETQTSRNCAMQSFRPKCLRTLSCEKSNCWQWQRLLDALLTLSHLFRPHVCQIGSQLVLLWSDSANPMSNCIQTGSLTPCPQCSTPGVCSGSNIQARKRPQPKTCCIAVLEILLCQFRQWFGTTMCVETILPTQNPFAHGGRPWSVASGSHSQFIMWTNWGICIHGSKTQWTPTQKMNIPNGVPYLLTGVMLPALLYRWLPVTCIFVAPSMRAGCTSRMRRARVAGMDGAHCNSCGSVTLNFVLGPAFVSESFLFASSLATYFKPLWVSAGYLLRTFWCCHGCMAWMATLAPPSMCDWCFRIVVGCLFEWILFLLLVPNYCPWNMSCQPFLI